MTEHLVIHAFHLYCELNPGLIKYDCVEALKKLTLFLLQEVCEQVWTTLYDYPGLRQCGSLRAYIEQAVRVAWALSVQTPAYTLRYDCQTFLNDSHERFHSSDPESTQISHILWPALVEGSSGPVVYKAVVIT